jgi:DNA-binding NarL/FixJ family response regulator
MARSVLIVDDSQNVRRVMRGFFDSLSDWTIAGEAAGGSEGIQKALELKPDLILLDFSMPEMNGIETASVLKKSLPDVRIIVFTLFDDAVGSRLGVAAGVDLIVPKADGLTGLVDAVNRLLGAPHHLRN